MAKIIIEVSGGIAKYIIADEPIQYVLVDWDNLEAGDEFPTMADFRDADLIINPIAAALASLQIDNMLKNEENEN